MDSDLTNEEIENAWYSLGLRGIASANEWNTRYKFAREIEKLVKAQEDQAPILSQSGAPCA